MKNKIVIEDSFDTLDEFDKHMVGSVEVDRVFNALSSDFDLSVQDAVILWKRYSRSLCAGWLNVPKEPEKILKCVMSVLLYKEVFPLAISSKICDKSKIK